MGEQHTVERLLAVRQGKEGREFVIRWLGRGSNEDIWEKEKNIEASLILDFDQSRFTRAPAPRKGSKQGAPELFLVEDVLESRTLDGVAQSKVSWLGFASRWNAWVDDDKMQQPPEMSSESGSREVEPPKAEMEPPPNVGRCEKNPLCTRGFKHQGRRGRCKTAPCKGRASAKQQHNIANNEDEDQLEEAKGNDADGSGGAAATSVAAGGDACLLTQSLGSALSISSPRLLAASLEVDSPDARVAPLPEGWHVEDHGSWKVYRGPGGEGVRSKKEAWRQHCAQSGAMRRAWRSSGRAPPPITAPPSSAVVHAPSRPQASSEPSARVPPAPAPPAEVAVSSSPLGLLASPAAPLSASPERAMTETPPDVGADELLGMDAIRKLLRAYRLEQYADAFDEQGYDDLPYLRELDEESLRKVVKDQIGMKPGHMERFIKWFHGKAA